MVKTQSNGKYLGTPLFDKFSGILQQIFGRKNENEAEYHLKLQTCLRGHKAWISFTFKEEIVCVLIQFTLHEIINCENLIGWLVLLQLLGMAKSTSTETFNHHTSLHT